MSNIYGYIYLGMVGFFSVYWIACIIVLMSDYKSHYSIMKNVKYTLKQGLKCSVMFTLFIGACLIPFLIGGYLFFNYFV